MKSVNIKLLLLLYLAIILYGCSENIVESTPSIDENQDPTSISAKFSDIQNKIFSESCALSGCHAGAVSPDLTSSAFERIVNKQSSSGLDYIEPGDPDKSYLLQKIIGSSTINGSRMPLNSSALSQNKIDALAEWISNGAENN